MIRRYRYDENAKLLTFSQTGVWCMFPDVLNALGISDGWMQTPATEVAPQELTDGEDLLTELDYMSAASAFSPKAKEVFRVAASHIRALRADLNLAQEEARSFKELAFGKALDATPEPPPMEDNPENDATDAAHPAWWRGNDRGVEAACEIVAKALDGIVSTNGVYSFPGLQEVVGRITRLRDRERIGNGDRERLRTTVENQRGHIITLQDDIKRLGNDKAALHGRIANIKAKMKQAIEGSEEEL